MTADTGIKVLTMKTLYTDLDNKLKERTGNALLNTSYPLSPSDWQQYVSTGNLEMDADKPMGLYIHVPFCWSHCRFCEYTTFSLYNNESKEVYVQNLRKDIMSFLDQYPATKLYGLDIGGGTPTFMKEETFQNLMELYMEILQKVETTEDFEPSIETIFFSSPRSVVNNKDKIRMIAEAGFRRISMGYQYTRQSNYKPLSADYLYEEEDCIESMRDCINYIHEVGIRKVNLDLMYGFNDQDLETIERDLDILAILNPEHVTLYELRRNMISSQPDFDTKDLHDYHEKNFSLYSALYKGLTQLGYHAPFGQNTFSRNESDAGMSSYLRHRMFDGWQYKGFGMSAQSMSSKGISYNIGKLQKWEVDYDTKKELEALIYSDTYDTTQHYALPPRELLGKFIAISGYSGGFSLAAARSIYGPDFDKDYKLILDYLQDRGFATIKGDRLQFTPEGFRIYGPLISLFHSHNQ